jgi:hypothetical protein
MRAVQTRMAQTLTLERKEHEEGKIITGFGGIADVIEKAKMVV